MGLWDTPACYSGVAGVFRRKATATSIRTARARQYGELIFGERARRCTSYISRTKNYWELFRTTLLSVVDNERYWYHTIDLVFHLPEVAFSLRRWRFWFSRLPHRLHCHLHLHLRSFYYQVLGLQLSCTLFSGEMIMRKRKIRWKYQSLMSKHDPFFHVWKSKNSYRLWCWKPSGRVGIRKRTKKDNSKQSLKKEGEREEEEKL